MTPITDPNYTAVVCSTCDPPSVVYVPVELIISEPYICTCCQQRALKRIARNSEARIGRMVHGATKLGVSYE